MNHILVTGASGFVGRALTQDLLARDYKVRGITRLARNLNSPPGLEWTEVPEIHGKTDWGPLLDGIDCIVHLAAWVHVLGVGDDKRAFDVNRDGTRRLAEQASASGVERLVFMSTVKVNGEQSGAGSYGPADVPRPVGAYAESKWQAEQALMEVCGASDLEAVIVRSPLVYGPGVGANFLRLMSMVERGVSLPLGAVKNRRSLVYVRNLCDLLCACLDHSEARGETLMVSDGTDISTPDLIRALANAMGVEARLFKVPPGLLRLAGSVLGKREMIDRLCGSLVIDMKRTRDLLHWSPPVAQPQGFEDTVRWYRQQRGSGE